MKSADTLIEFNVIPIGHTKNESISPTVAKVVKHIKSSGLPNETHAMGTVIEGTLDECLELVKTCIQESLKDTPRVTASVRLDVRPGHDGRIESSVRSVEEQWRSEPVSR